MNRLPDNWDTDYEVGYWFTVGYMARVVKEIRQDENGFNEYLLNTGEWVTGRYITTCSD